MPLGLEVGQARSTIGCRSTPLPAQQCGYGCRLDSELQNVRGSLQAQIQDLTAQLVASQQQCTDLEAVAAAATAYSKHSCTNPRAQGPKINGCVLVDPEPLHSQPAHQHRPQQAAEETARTSQGSSTPWRDALGLDSDSDAEHPASSALTHIPELARSLTSGPAHMAQPVAAGKSHLVADLARSHMQNVEEGTGNPSAGLPLAVTSPPMHCQMPGSLQGHGAIVVVPEGGAVSSTSRREVGWHQGSGTMQHVVSLSDGNLWPPRSLVVKILAENVLPS